ncbi:MAG TPA: DUF2891 domain-containing protein [Kofleriaceae bacterium]|nr:DUF2891 domain-containing protein [Kofleriaceae bacterium]
MLALDQASQFAQLALACVRRELPHKLDHLLLAGTTPSPRELHPAFYGCLDWHSAVHGHWMLARLLEKFPTLPEAAAIRATFDDTLTAENLATEAAYFTDRPSFERMYGWAWLLKLACDLPAPWRAPLQPLVDVIVESYRAFLPKQTYPVRTGVHSNTAFGLTFALDYARAVSDQALEQLIVDRSVAYYGGDVSAPSAWEPSGEDFLSPSLVEADLMRRVVPDFPTWFVRFIPTLSPSLRSPAVVSDRSDPKLAHLDGLNLSRAWCLRNIAEALPPTPLRDELEVAAAAHARDGLKHVATGQYMGEHWLASFAVYLEVPA